MIFCPTLCYISFYCSHAQKPETCLFFKSSFPFRSCLSLTNPPPLPLHPFIVFLRSVLSPLCLSQIWCWPFWTHQWDFTSWLLLAWSSVLRPDSNLAKPACPMRCQPWLDSLFLKLAINLADGTCWGPILTQNWPWQLRSVECLGSALV